MRVPGDKQRYRIVIWECYSSVSGGQRVALNIAERLGKKFDIDFIVPSEGQLSAALDKKGIQWSLVPIGVYQRSKKGLADIIKYIWSTPLALWRAGKIVKGSDMLYANSSKLFVWSAILGTFMNVPVVWHLHNLFTDKKSRALVKFFGQWTSVKKIIAVSEAAQDQFRALTGKTEVIYNGIDIEKYQPGTGRKLEGNKFRVGVIADLLPQKGHDTLIRAISIIKGSLPVSLKIVGAVADNNYVYAQKLKDLVNRLGLEENVELAGYRSDIPDILKSLDLLVVPSSSFEACPMAALEAFACGVPVIGSDLGGTPELIEGGRTGYIFKAGDAHSLAEKIQLIFANHELYNSMCINCRRIAEKRFDLKKHGDKIESLLLEVI